MKCKITVFVIMLSFLCSFMLQPLTVEAAYGTTGNWTGNLDIYGVNTYARIVEKNDFSYSYDSTSGDITSDSYYALYEMNIPLRFNISGLTPGYIYNGTATRYCEFSINEGAFPVSVSLVKSMQLSLEYYSFNDDVSVQMYYVDSNNPQNMQFKVRFDNYCAEKSDLIFEIPLKIQFHVINNANSNYVGRVSLNYENGTDTAGIVKYYTDLRDVPNIDGFIADQNQQIIDGIDENTVAIEDLNNNIGSWFTDLKTNLGSWFLDQKSNINTRFSELTNNLSYWFSGLTSTINSRFDELLNQNSDEHEETINGYQGTGTPEASQKFDQSAGELESVESDLTGITNSSIDNYTTAAFDASIITSLGPSLVYVVTWFTNFWNIGGLFTSLLNVGLALLVAAFMLRLHGGGK